MQVAGSLTFDLLDSPDVLHDLVVALCVAAPTDEVDKVLVMADDDQLEVLLIRTSIPANSGQYAVVITTTSHTHSPSYKNLASLTTSAN